MSEEGSREVPVTFAEGVRDDVASLVASSAHDDEAGKSDIEALKRRIAELLVERRSRRSCASRTGAHLRTLEAPC